MQRRRLSAALILLAAVLALAGHLRAPAPQKGLFLPVQAPPLHPAGLTVLEPVPAVRPQVVAAAMLGRRAAVLAGASSALGLVPGLGATRLQGARAEPAAQLSPAQLLSVGQYIPDLRDARRALDGVRLLAERDDERGYEEVRQALLTVPINGIRKAASKVLKEIKDDGYRAQRTAQYETIKQYLTVIDDKARPGADRSGVNLPEQVALLQKSID